MNGTTWHTRRRRNAQQISPKQMHNVIAAPHSVGNAFIADTVTAGINVNKYHRNVKQNNKTSASSK